MNLPALIAHCDWSTSPGKRWMATARQEGDTYHLDAPLQVPDAGGLVPALRAVTGPGRGVLAGFDFPIGLPRAYGERTGLSGFRTALDVLGRGPWADWYEVAGCRTEVGLHRPFYPSGTGGRRQAHLLDGLGVGHIDDLRRTCELKTPERRAACPLFWTLGGNQVGKAAISGWREVVVPALADGAALWPFDGPLAALLDRGGVVLAETYPADAYGQIGLRFAHGMSKRKQSDRKSLAAPMLDWASRRAMRLSPPLREAIQEGFGEDASGEDAFDAVTGLFGMLEVVTGHRAEGSPDLAHVRTWEGWIFGQGGTKPLPSTTPLAA